MSRERKSKRQERRDQIRQQERRSRLITIGLIVLGVAFVVFVVASQLRPVAQIVSVDPGTHFQPNDNTMGDPNAPIKVEEFSDFQCPFCARFHTETEPLLRQYYIDTGKIQFVYRSMGNFVSDNIARARGTAPKTESEDAALAAYCAGDQDMFWEMHAHLFANALGEDAGSFTDNRLKEIANTAGLDTNAFNSCYESGKFRDRIQRDFEEARVANFDSTPSFLVTYTVNGETKTRSIVGAQPFSTFQQELEAALHEMGVQPE